MMAMVVQVVQMVPVVPMLQVIRLVRAGVSILPYLGISIPRKNSQF